MKLIGLGMTVAAERQALRRRSTMTCRCSRSVPPTVLSCPFYGETPDRQASIERRRRQAMSGAVPATIAASFTPGELAVLSVVARMVQRSGVCVLPIDAIAALAGVSRTTAKNAMRQARTRGLIEVKERRRRGLPSLTNIIRVISAEWGHRRGCSKAHSKPIEL